MDGPTMSDTSPTHSFELDEIDVIAHSFRYTCRVCGLWRTLAVGKPEEFIFSFDRTWTRFNKEPTCHDVLRKAGRFERYRV